MFSEHQQHLSSSDARPPRRALMIAVLMTALIVAFFFLREHWGHVAGYWPYLLLLACPVIHLFHGHGGHGHDDGQRTGADQPAAKGK